MSKNLSELLQKFNRNTSLYAKDLKLQKNRLNRLFSIRRYSQDFLSLSYPDQVSDLEDLVF